MKKILITSALPYANGPLHMGHIFEHTMSDMLNRFFKLDGRNSIYCCADDTHGTPIEMNAQKEGITPEQLIEKSFKDHQEDFKSFQIEFDSYTSTNDKNNKMFALDIFSKLQEKNLIYTKQLKQFYCETDKRFLPDRYIRGKCPKCEAEDQYGDICESCNSTYDALELKEPYCSLCKNKPVEKESKHYFFKLSQCTEQIEEFLKNPNLQKEAVNFSKNWIKEGLKDWCISRDKPYFGFLIPGETDKYFYTWLDAPIGYISSSYTYATANDINFKQYWDSDDSTIIHNIGKDIIYFHYLFWPAMLINAGYKMPDKIITHGFLNFFDKKMSKSKGIGFGPKAYLEHLPPEYMRYYLAASIGTKMEDVNFDTEVFKDRSNTQLVGNISNFMYRSMSMIHKNFGKLGETNEDYNKLKEKFPQVKEYFEKADFKNAIKIIQEISSGGNKYFQDKEPWKLIKEDKEQAHVVLTNAIHLVKDLAISLMPVIPKYSEDILLKLNINGVKWSDIGGAIPKDHPVRTPQILLKKIETEVDKLIKVDPFSKLDLKVGKIMSIGDHPNADKLYIISLDVGGEKRQIVSGLKDHYTKGDLIEKNVILVANLKPAKLRGVLSEGMLLAADNEEKVEVLFPTGAPGTTVTAEGVKKNPAPQIEYKEFSEIKLVVRDGNVWYEDHILKSDTEIECSLPDGSSIR